MNINQIFVVWAIFWVLVGEMVGTVSTYIVFKGISIKNYKNKESDLCSHGVPWDECPVCCH